MNTQESPFAFEGILLVDKPTGCTSHDVVDVIRRKFRMKRVGHAGTLDPLATGLLILLLGKATKASQYLTSLNKEYEGTIKLGEATDSHDSDGLVIEQKDIPDDLTDERLQQAMRSFMGDQYQVPPMFSAKKVNGTPLYKIARKGKTVQRDPRLIHISKFDLLDFKSPYIRFCLACSKGTYVRTVAHTLGERLQCAAHLTALRRTRTDRFSVGEALTLDEIQQTNIIDLKSRLLPIYDAVPSLVCG